MTEGRGASPTFVLYRILGNDLPPLHRPGQTLDNLRFILDHEPPLAGCEKRWVVNRIVDPVVEAEALRLIAAAGHGAIRIPFDRDAYRRQPFEIERVHSDRFHHRPGFDAMRPVYRSMLTAVCLEARNRYAMNNNGARNAALDEGRTRADWVLPWDGGCFVPAASWSEIVAAAGDPALRHLIVPLARLDDNAEALDPARRPADLDEPQIAFGPGTSDRFDEAVAYGASPKAALLVRLGVPGKWAGWEPARVAADRLGPSPEAGRHREAGWVWRLSTGGAGTRADDDRRFRLRLGATIRFLRGLDAEMLAGSRRPGEPLLFDLAALARLTARTRAGDLRCIALVKDLRDRMRGVMHRPVPRPEAAPLSMFEAGHDALAAALAAAVTGQRDPAARAWEIVRAWLVEPATRLAPRLPASDDARDVAAFVAGILALIDAARLAAADRRDAVDPWIDSLLQWVRSSAEGRAMRFNDGLGGTCHDLLVLAGEAHLDRLRAAAEALDWTTMRIAHQVRPDGRLVRADGSTSSGLATVLNLEAWCAVARIADRLGRDVRGPVGADGRSLARVADLLGQRMEAMPEDGPARPHGRRRIQPIVAILGTADPGEPRPAMLPPSHRGSPLPPFWTLGMPARAPSQAAPGSHLPARPVSMISIRRADRRGRGSDEQERGTE